MKGLSEEFVRGKNVNFWLKLGALILYGVKEE